jgi:hypothetical protein
MRLFRSKEERRAWAIRGTHAHFFTTFDKFLLAQLNGVGEQLTEASARAAEDHAVSACAGRRPGGKPAAGCQEFLQASEKARMAWQVEGEFEGFEQRF